MAHVAFTERCDHRGCHRRATERQASPVGGADRPLPTGTDPLQWCPLHVPGRTRTRPLHEGDPSAHPELRLGHALRHHLTVGTRRQRRAWR